MQNVGYIQADNAWNNGMMIRAIGRHLANIDINYDTEYRRLRCMGHVINLSVRLFWFGEDVDRDRKSVV